jgi:hypothetical protein
VGHAAATALLARPPSLPIGAQQLIAFWTGEHVPLVVFGKHNCPRCRRYVVELEAGGDTPFIIDVSAHKDAAAIESALLQQPQAMRGRGTRPARLPVAYRRGVRLPSDTDSTVANGPLRTHTASGVRRDGALALLNRTSGTWTWRHATLSAHPQHGGPVLVLKSRPTSTKALLRCTVTAVRQAKSRDQDQNDRFEVQVCAGGSCSTKTLGASSPEDCSAWITALTDLLDEQLGPHGGGRRSRVTADSNTSSRDAVRRAVPLHLRRRGGAAAVVVPAGTMGLWAEELGSLREARKWVRELSALFELHGVAAATGVRFAGRAVAEDRPHMYVPRDDGKVAIDRCP